MQEETKKYLKDLIKDIDIEINDMEFEIQNLQKNMRKMKKFYDKVIGKL